MATIAGLVSIVLVTYQSAADLPECFGLLAAAAGLRPTEVVVVDNSSRDNSTDLAREFDAKVLETTRMRGCRPESTAALRQPGRTLY